MKKLLTMSIVLLLSISSAFAKNVKVEALSDFSTETPAQFWSVKIVEGFTTKNRYPVYAGSIVKGKIENVVEPKRLKRNAAFTFIPINYFDYNTQQWFDINQEISAKYSPISDVSVKSVAKTGAVMVGNKLVDGFFGPGVALVEGVVKNEQGNRAKSAVVSVYESTPLSLANKGKQLEIKEGQVFVMNFKMPDGE